MARSQENQSPETAPVAVRQRFADLLEYRRRCVGTEHTRWASQSILDMLKLHPYLMDTIPWDVFDLCRAAVAPKVQS